MAPRLTYRVELAYDGARFAGFQQQQGQRTVESVIVAGLQPWLPDLPRVAVAGRTDRGVHAYGQVVSFYARKQLDLERIAVALEEAGAGDVAVRDIRVMPRRFHACFSATARSYVYRYPDDGLPLVISRLDTMLGALVGRRCFFAFSRRTPVGQSSTRHMMRARVFRDHGGGARFELTANGFLRRQVRVLVATAIREARTTNANDAAPTRLLDLSNLGDRAATAPPADPGGLWLTEVSYV